MRLQLLLTFDKQNKSLCVRACVSWSLSLPLLLVMCVCGLILEQVHKNAFNCALTSININVNSKEKVNRLRTPRVVASSEMKEKHMTTMAVAMTMVRSHGMPNKRWEWNETRNRFRDSPTWNDGQFIYNNHVLNYCNKETCATYFDERRALRRRRRGMKSKRNGTSRRKFPKCFISFASTQTVSTVNIYNQFTLPLTLRHSSSWMCFFFFLLCPSLAFIFGC